MKVPGSLPGQFIRQFIYNLRWTGILCSSGPLDNNSTPGVCVGNSFMVEQVSTSLGCSSCLAGSPQLRIHELGMLLVHVANALQMLE